MTSQAKAKSIPVGWVGTGVMGASMAAHLQKAGYPLRVYNRTRSKAEALLAGGAVWCDSPAEVAKDSRFVFSIVGFPDDVREVYLGASGILSAVRPGSILIDMTTSEPTLAREIARAAEKKQAMALDAPVSGGDVGAREARLCIMAGGPEEAFEATLPLLRLMGKTIQRFGGPGAGQHTKMVNQVFITGVMIGLCEGLVYGHRAGLPLEQLVETLSTGAAQSWSLQNLAPRCLAGDFEPGFFAEHFIKDMGIALAEAGRMNLSLPGLALVHQLYVALEAQGGGRQGTQALLLALERLSGLEHFAGLDKRRNRNDRQRTQNTHSRRGFLKNAGLGAAVIALGGVKGCRSGSGTQSPVRPTARQPYNFVTIAIDTLRQDHLGCYGYPRNTSPYIDEFAEKCFKFSEAISPSGWTIPSFASLFTGQYSMNHHIIGHNSLVPENTLMVQQLLQERGYQGMCSVARSFLSMMAKRGLSKGFDKFDIWDRYSSEQYDAAIKFIQGNRNNRFNLFFHTFDVHGPYLPPPPFNDLFDFEKNGEEVGIDDKPWDLKEVVVPKGGVTRAFVEAMKSKNCDYIRSQYDGTIRFVDSQVGRILDVLKEGFLENTVVLIMSDHGESLGEHDLFFAHDIFYEGVLKIPLLVYIPNTTPREIHSQVQLEDIAPTMCELSDTQIPESMDGKGLYPLLTGTSEKRRDFTYSVGVFWSSIRGALNHDLWKLVLTEGTSPKGRRLHKPYLFNLTKDPGELEDLYEKEPEIREHLRGEFDSWKARCARGETKGQTEEVDLDTETVEMLRGFGYLE